MAGTGDDVSTSQTSSPLLGFVSVLPAAIGSPYAPWLCELKSEERGLFLIHLLHSCAKHVAAGNLDQVNSFMEKIWLLTTPDGDTMQRIATYFAEALARRLLRCWPGLYNALNPCHPVAAAEAAAASMHGRRLFFDLFPFLRLSLLVSSQAILEAMEGEKVVHVIDLGGTDPALWTALLQALAIRPNGPPHLRITAVSEHRDLLARSASSLSEEAEKLDIPFQFHAVVSQLDALDFKSLRVKTGEALAITSVLQLHSLLASNDYTSPRKKTSKLQAAASASCSLSQQLKNMIQSGGSCGMLGELYESEHGNNGFSPGSESSLAFAPAPISKMVSFLASLWELSPKIMVVTEQESNHNGATLNERFVEALNFYAALFDCLESTVQQQAAERMAVERLLFREEINNIIVCEGSERKERHEKLERWMQRLEMAGFGRVGLSCFSLLQARRMLQGFGWDGYKVKEEDGCFLFCWQDRALFSVSAWRLRRYD